MLDISLHPLLGMETTTLVVDIVMHSVGLMLCQQLHIHTAVQN